VRIRWYRVTPDRPLLPYPTIFSSWNWEQEGENTHTACAGTLFQGEQLTSDRNWNNGKVPLGYPFLGNTPCGTAEQWGGDLLRARDLPLVNDFLGSPTCCTGLAPGVVCSNCPSGFASSSYYLTCSTATGMWDAINGTWELTYRGNCTWAGPSISVPGAPGNVAIWSINRRANGATQGLRISLGSTAGAGNELLYNTGINWDCAADLTDVAIPSGQVFANLPQVIDLISASPGGAMPLIGTVIWDAGTGPVPSRYLICDGTAVSRATYAQLFGRLGVTWGPGDGSTTFNLPDFRNRVPIGAGMTYGTGDTGGEAAHTLVAGEVPAVPIVVTDHGHTHPTAGGTNFLSGTVGARSTLNVVGVTTGVNITGASLDTDTGTNTTGITAAQPTAGGGPHNNLPPYAALRPLVYTGVP
jgi:microcystin-dependent protein